MKPNLVEICPHSESCSLDSSTFQMHHDPHSSSHTRPPSFLFRTLNHPTIHDPHPTTKPNKLFLVYCTHGEVLLVNCCMHVHLQKGTEKQKKTIDTVTQTHMQAAYTNTHTHICIPPPHSYSFPAMEQREVVADVKHQFPG